jgi:putative ABC transport system ATP-binding protein
MDAKRNPHLVIEAAGLTKVYAMGGGSNVHALNGVDLQVRHGEFVAFMGASGSGKSTLLHLLGCLDRPSAGEYRLEGEEVSRLTADQRAHVRNVRMGFIFQTFNLLPNATALENAVLPLLYQGVRGDILQRGRAVLAELGLESRLGHVPSQLSGGQCQRVAIARALVTDPALVLADEPTGNLDSATGGEIMQLLASMHQRGRTILLVTHDEQVARYAQRVLYMQDGKFISEDVHDLH